MSVARLGYEIDSSPLAEAVAGHERFVTSAGKVEQAAGRVGGAGTRMSRGFADLNPTLDKIVGSLARLDATTVSIDKRLAAMASAANNAAKANGNLDRSAIEASTAYKQLEASLNAVTAAQRKSDAANATSLSQIQKQRDAIAALNVELQKLRAAPAVPGSGRPSPANNNGGQAGVGNVAAQLFDTLSTAPYMSAGTIGFQQGPQFAQAFAGQSAKQALSGLAAGVAAIVSPVSLAAIGLTAAAAAAVQFGSSLFNSASKAQEVLEKHEATMGRIKDLYEKAGDAGEDYGRRVSDAVNFEGRQDRNRLELLQRLQSRDLTSQLGIDFSRMGSGSNLIGNAPSEAYLKGQAQGKYGPYGDAILKYAEAAKDGRGDVKELNDEIFRIANDNSTVKKWQEYATTLLGWTASLTTTTERVRELNKELFKAQTGQRGVMINTPEYRQMLDDMSNSDAAERNGIRDLNLNYSAEVASLKARSPQQRAAAARQAAAARTVQGESGPLRDARIEAAGRIELARAEQQLSEAQRDRALNLDKILDDQRMDIDLIGKTGGAAAALRKQYELTSQLRMEAARNGTEVDQKELDLIHQKTAALAPLCDPYDQTAFAAGFNIENEE
ncbi:hypothetical protein PMI07_002068 [Rhizobium sp. CF080]|uniref:hypothetical protein n=1 Tax=Rhizobium sp. (strain CF080) TaxID=1144310 RepID=UPI0003E7D8C8|nr:hypothetical protein [Rhizobium sp. CF080]EUB95580.1 hypothetical protein PMI07_002068 [Rhizobium sp. CF080]